MKKYLIVILVIVLVLVVVGCSATRNNVTVDPPKEANEMKIVIENSKDNIKTINVDLDKIKTPSIFAAFEYYEIPYRYDKMDFDILDSLKASEDGNNAYLIYCYISKDSYQDTTEYVRVMNYENTVLKTINDEPAKIVLEKGMIIYFKVDIM